MSYGKKIAETIRDGDNKALYTDPKKKITYYNHEEGNLKFQVKFREFGKFGVELDTITVSSTKPLPNLDVSRQLIEEQAEKVQESITFLPENFRLIEMDHTVKKAQLRSYPPVQEEDSKYYHEVVLEDGNNAHFQRYQFSREKKRYQKVNSQLTRESFEKLIDTFADLF
ncbi:MAG: hypothetical protein ACRBF0_08250 [Calditrichia bacterium]